MNAHASMLSLILMLLISVPAGAQQTTGKPGAPSATTTIGGQQLPPPPPVFRGKIEQCGAIDALLAGARGAAQGRAQPHPGDPSSPACARVTPQRLPNG
jgi:hypothetical protein